MNRRRAFWILWCSWLWGKLECCCCRRWGSWHPLSLSLSDSGAAESLSTGKLQRSSPTFFNTHATKATPVTIKNNSNDVAGSPQTRKTRMEMHSNPLSAPRFMLLSNHQQKQNYPQHQQQQSTQQNQSPDAIPHKSVRMLRPTFSSPQRRDHHGLGNGPTIRRKLLLLLPRMILLAAVPAAASAAPTSSSSIQQQLHQALELELGRLNQNQSHNNILFFFPQPRPRRPLDVCLVALLRVLYWAERMAQLLAFSSSTTISTSSSSSSSSFVSLSVNEAYLETRLGAKAVLTSRVGDGGTPYYFVYTLANLHVSACLEDIRQATTTVLTTSHGHGHHDHSSVFVLETLIADWREALATLVEFDGLDSVLEMSSPRVSLIQAQYTDAKRQYCFRVLSERVLPLGHQLIASATTRRMMMMTVLPTQSTSDSDGTAALDRAITYVASYYPSEIPQPKGFSSITHSPSD